VDDTGGEGGDGGRYVKRTVYWSDVHQSQHKTIEDSLIPKLFQR